MLKSWDTKIVFGVLILKLITVLTLLHSKWPKLHRVLAVLRAKGLKLWMRFLIHVYMYNSEYRSS